MKKIPIGIDNFEKLIRGDYYFVDKSLLIKDILEEGSEVLLITRPRRFGKSLNMSMMRYFFNLINGEKNRELFRGLKIEKEEVMSKQGKYPVIYMSFKDIKEIKWKDCYNKTVSLISNIYNEFEFLLNREILNPKSEKKFKEIWLEEATQTDYENSIKFLCELLYKYYGNKVIILIDEYDQPIISAYMNGYYEEGISFYRNFLSAMLKDNEYLEKAVLTGVLRVAKESIFSGLNNLYVDSIVKNNFKYFGLLEEEVEEMLKYYNMEYEMVEVRDWYNGYTFGKNLVYNPWSIINYVHDRVLQPYWVNTSSNDLIREGLKNISKEDYDNLIKLSEGEEIGIEINENISFDDLDNSDVIWNLMLFSGYLSLSEGNKVRFPNKEVKDFYIKQFKQLAGHSINQFNTLSEFLIKKDIKNFKGLLQEIFYKAVSYYDVGKEEQYYHNLMLGFAFGLSDKYIVHSNREYGTGRVDLLLKGRDGKLPNYIFEFKVSRKLEDLEKDAKEAIEQIEAKKYAIEVEDAVKVGMSFCGKEIYLIISNN